MKTVLDEVKQAAEGEKSHIQPIIEAWKAKATIGEICAVLREVFVEYRPPHAL